MGLSIITLSKGMMPGEEHSANGTCWHVMADSVVELLNVRTRDFEREFEHLNRIKIDSFVEYFGVQQLEALISE